MMLLLLDRGFGESRGSGESLLLSCLFVRAVLSVRSVLAVLSVACAHWRSGDDLRAAAAAIAAALTMWWRGDWGAALETVQEHAFIAAIDK